MSAFTFHKHRVCSAVPSRLWISWVIGASLLAVFLPHEGRAPDLHPIGNPVSEQPDGHPPTPVSVKARMSHRFYFARFQQTQGTTGAGRNSRAREDIKTLGRCLTLTSSDTIQSVSPNPGVLKLTSARESRTFGWVDSFLLRRPPSRGWNRS